ncbi:hypothetical protein Tco_1396656, partial [Tanacetum coccineum]
DDEEVTTVVFSPDHMAYQHKYCADCVLTFTSSCIQIEGSFLDDDDEEPFRLEWLSYTAPVDRSRDVDFMMSLMRSDNRFADAFARYDSGGASGSGGSRARDSEGGEDGDDTGREDGGDDTIVVSVYRSFPSDMSLGNLLPPWHQFLDQKIRGAHFSLGIVAEERFAIELTPSTFPHRHFAGDIFPQRHVAGERVGMLLGKASNVVVCMDLQHVLNPLSLVKS